MYNEEEHKQAFGYFMRATHELNQTGAKCIEHMPMQAFLMAEIMHAIESAWLAAKDKETRDSIIALLRQTFENGIIRIEQVYGNPDGQAVNPADTAQQDNAEEGTTNDQQAD